jgi:Uma2 family endonuclease
MAMPAVAPRRWTAAEVRALPNEPGKRFECVDGELLMSPSSRLPHQWALVALFRLLDGCCREHGIGAVGVAPSDFELDQHTLVQPGLFIVPLVGARRPVAEEQVGAPLLFVEVLLPSTARADRVLKRRRYQRHGVPSWIVDVDARLVEIWAPDAERPEVITGALRWQPEGATEPGAIDLDALFAEALGER